MSMWCSDTGIREAIARHRDWEEARRRPRCQWHSRQEAGEAAPAAVCFHGACPLLLILPLWWYATDAIATAILLL